MSSKNHPRPAGRRGQLRAWSALLSLALIAFFVGQRHLAEVSRCIPTSLRIPRSGGAVNHHLPADLILGLSHHKTGTSQMGCMLYAIAESAGLPTPLYMNDEARIENITRHLANVGAAARKPATFATGHVLWSQQCYVTSSAGEVKLCPWRAPCRCKDAACTEFQNVIELGKCFMSLPAVSLRILHFIRNPIDTVISAYLYHSQLPPPEDWINLEATSYAGVLTNLGVDPGILSYLGMSSQNTTYGGVLQSLPDEHGIQLEFWRSLPELYDMARQFTMLKETSQTLHIRFEDLRFDFNETALSIIDTLYPAYEPQALLGSLHSSSQQCDPATWTAEKLAADPKVRAHITTTSKSTRHARVARLTGYLLSIDIVKEKLCELCSILGYSDRRCR